MNMVRIRHIMQMRRACKAPPLLPPKPRKENSDGVERRMSKDVLDIQLRIRIVEVRAIRSPNFRLAASESEQGPHGPWTLITETDELEAAQDYELEDMLGVEFAFERAQPIRIELLDGETSAVIASIVFLLSDIVTSQLSTKLIDASGVVVAEVEVWSKVREKAQPIALQIEARNLSSKVLTSTSPVFLEVYRIDGDERRLVYRSEGAKTTRLIWRSFTLSNTEETIELICTHDDENSGVIARCTLEMEEIKAHDVFPLFCSAYKQGKKPCGEIRFTRRAQLRIFSFLDYIKFGTSLRFCFAIDFSHKDALTRHEHMQYANDVEFVVRSLCAAVLPFNSSNSFLAYGLGAKIPPQYRESNNFCLSLDVDAMCFGAQHVVASFVNAFQQVQPLQSAHFSHILYHMSKNAQNNCNRESASSQLYTVLFVVTRGAIDDLKETVQAAIFASKSPISICFIGVGCEGLAEVERIGSAGRRLEYHGRKSERGHMHFVNVTKTRLENENPEEATTAFAEKVLAPIPRQISSYMMQSNVLPVRSGDEDPAEPRRPSSSLSRHSLDEFEHRFEQDRSDGSDVIGARPLGASSSAWDSQWDEQTQRRGRLSADMRSLTIGQEVTRRYS